MGATLGCSVATEGSDPPGPQSASTHALIQVHRQELVGEDARADALASFVRLPATADPSDVLTLAGLRDRLPPVGQCQLGSPTDSASLDVGDVELVDAAWVRLETPVGVHDLAPHAFPTVTDWIRGVVYASRDQDASSLPAGEQYTFAASSVEGLGDLEALHQSPPPLRGVLIQGVPIESLHELEGGIIGESGEVAIEWTPSEDPLDTVVVRARFDETEWSCSYSDARGRGAVALVEPDGSALPPGSRATVSVHRVRAVATSGPDEASLIEVRFDFSVAAELMRR